ncbi:MAG TPA: hypothetical protein VNA89_00520 [Gemmatimonadaceae bacterium]|nr:hypothetical protein [Gemmatimonadaceae bacterium]
MNAAILFLLAQGVLGTFDTLWYHEYKLRLPHAHTARAELRLHAARDFAYALIFASLAWVEWRGALAWVFLGTLVFEIVVTLWDFVEEDRTRTLPPGERITHAIMGILYGAFLYTLVPELWAWSRSTTGFEIIDRGPVSLVLTVFAIGVAGSGLRDLRASYAARPVPA